MPKTSNKNDKPKTKQNKKETVRQNKYQSLQQPAILHSHHHFVEEMSI